MKPIKEKFECTRCKSRRTNDVETEDSDIKTYTAVFERGTAKEGDLLRVTITSSNPLKAVVGEDVDWIKESAQKQLISDKDVEED